MTKVAEIASCAYNQGKCVQLFVDIIFSSFYYAAVLTGRITGLARPSVRPSVCHAWVLNLKTKRLRKTEIGVNDSVCQFSAQKIKDQRSSDVKNLQKMRHISRQRLPASPGTPGAAIDSVEVEFQ